MKSYEKKGEEERKIGWRKEKIDGGKERNVQRESGKIESEKEK